MPYKRHAKVLYRFYTWGLTLLSPVKPLFRFALRVLTHQKHAVKGHILPLNVKLGQPEQSALGRDVLTELISRSTAVGAMSECLCRVVGGCTEYPADIGCLVLGDAVQSLHKGLGHAVSHREALERVDRALALGLVPMVIHFKNDAVLWSLEHSRMLTICFCCPCHCLIRQAIGQRKNINSTNVTGLPGVLVRLDPDKCACCGKCTGACFMGALELKGGIPIIASDRCVACGRCAMACPTGALAIDAEGTFDSAPLVREYEKRTEKNSVFM